MDDRLKIDAEAIFYHGTDAFFEQFEDSYRGSNTAWDNTVHGFFFADKKENALLFGNTIVEARLTVLNPIDLRLHSIFDMESQASLIWEILSSEKLSNSRALDILMEEISLGEIGEMYDALNNEDAHEMMIAAGYDGMVSSLGNEELEFVVFRASQIEVLSIERPLSIGRSQR